MYTFKNDAVLRALEQYIGGSNVMRAPYSGEMGAIGAALLTRQKVEREGIQQSNFIGFEALADFTYEQKSDMPCPFCVNHCNRTIVQFSNGGS